MTYEEHKTCERMKELKKSVEILRLTVERQFSPNEAVENAIQGIEMEVVLLVSCLKLEDKKET